MSAAQQERDHAPADGWGLATISPRAAFVIRYAVAIAVSVAVAQTPGLVESQSSWIIVTVVSVVMPLSGGSLVQAALRLGGTVAAALVAILLFGLFAQNPPLMLASFFLVQVIGAYGFTGPRYQYAPYCFAFTSGIILGDVVAGKGAVETIAFERASMVAIGILIALVAELFSPTRAETSLREGLAARARSLGRAFREALDSENSGLLETPRESDSLVRQLGLIDSLRAEIGVSRREVTALTHTALQLEILAARASALMQTRSPSAPSPGREALGRSLESGLERIAEAIAARRAPVPFSRDVADRLRRTGEALDASQRELLSDVSNLYADLEETLNRVMNGDTPQRTNVSAAPRNWARLRIDPFRLKTSFRVGIAVCASYLAMIGLGWPLNLLILQVAFRGASPTTRGASSQRAIAVAVTVAIAWLGLDLAIVYLFPAVGRLPLALIFPILIAGGFAYWRFPRPTYKDVNDNAMQVALVPAFGSLAAPTDVYGAYSTVCIVALGALVGWASTRLFWPADAETLFRARAARQIELAIEAISTLDSDDSWQQSDDLVRAYGNQLAQIGALDQEARLEPQRQGMDDDRRAELVVLTGHLFEAALTVLRVSPDRESEIAERSGNASSAPTASLKRFDTTLATTLQACAEAIRGEPALPASMLTPAFDALRASLGTLERSLDGDEARARLEPRKSLVNRGRAIGAWIDGGLRHAHADFS
ncbi:MAG: FUSC family protein [Myxococcota bacterium]